MTTKPDCGPEAIDSAALVAKKRRRARWIAGGVVLALAGAAGAVAVPNLRSANLNRNESAAIATLKNISSAQSQMQACGLLDRNGNGSGEYAYFAELSGGVKLPGMDQPLTPPVLSQAFQAVVGGRVERSGYLFEMILPDAQMQAVREGPDGGRAGQQGSVDPALAETLWACYAWPASQGWSGKRTFFVNQSGDVLATNGFGSRPYDGARSVVPPDAAYARSAGRHMGAPVAANTVGNDGNTWVVV